MTALMRLVELDGGSILLDGVDIRLVGLSKLRSNIAVIPQVSCRGYTCSVRWRG
jgi:ABC-type multidrug transport system fused ATPase/permease subunit